MDEAGERTHVKFRIVMERFEQIRKEAYNRDYYGKERDLFEEGAEFADEHRWISVGDELPATHEDDDNVWDRSDDVFVFTKDGKVEIAYFETHGMLGDKKIELWYKRDGNKYSTDGELYGKREVMYWQPITTPKGDKK